MQRNFYDSPVLCINEAPEVEAHILAEGEKVKGVGEPGVPPSAPALANAILQQQVSALVKCRLT